MNLPLWPGKPPHSAAGDTFEPWLELFPVTTLKPRGAVVVFPGGGYGGRAAHEGGVIAQRFNAAGFHAFVCHYRVSPNRHPAPLLDAQRAVRLVRSRAVEWNVAPDRIAVCGFSAGGHLAASAGVHFIPGKSKAADPVERVSSRPDAMILCYPVLSSGTFAHRGSFLNLLGDPPPADLLEKMSLELQVSAQTPPTFLWHTSDDAGVPVENSLLFSMALRKHKIPFELHVYPQGNHGLGLAPAQPHIATWSTLCYEWLTGMGW